MLSLTCKTAIKAVIFLASRSASGEKTGIKAISGYIAASEHTVGKMLQILVREQVINSVKGPNGGFYITPRQMKQPIMHIIEAIDGKDFFNQCGLGLSKCSATRPCPIHDDYKKIRDQFKEICQRRKINEMAGFVTEGMAYLLG